MNEFSLRAEDGDWPRFGDYAVVEQKRHGVSNEMYYHKVVATLNSNSWVDVPVQSPAKETLHDTSERIAIVICCGVDESKTYRVRVADLHKVEVTGRPGEAMSGWIKCSDRLPELQDDSVLAYADGTSPHAGRHAWPKGGMDMVHIEDYFGDVTAGLDDAGNRLYTKMYLSNGVTHWQPLPSPPTE